jgi:hypothetical protein
MIFEHIKCPINKYTFSVKQIREWVVKNCENCNGKILNLFAGLTILPLLKEVRNDIDKTMIADYYMDAVDFLRMAINDKMIFDAIILDPPYAYRKSMELYNGHLNSRFKMVKDLIPDVLIKNGRVITLGYHSISMGKQRGFSIEAIALFSHGGAIHDTIGTVEVYNH